MNPTRDRVLVFDVNETLLDLGALDPQFARVFGDPAVRREWFATMLQSALLLTVTGQVAEAQLANAGIRDLCDQALSADDAKRLKPAPEAYAAAARKLDVPLDRIRLVAAHAWDVAGAMRAGAAAAFVARPGALWNPLLEKPDVWGKDLREVADQIIARDR